MKLRVKSGAIVFLDKLKKSPKRGIFEHFSLIFSDFLVLVIGLEPIRLLHRGILSPLRLPIPPHKHLVYLIVLFTFILQYNGF